MSIFQSKSAEMLVSKHLLGKEYAVYIPLADVGVDLVVEPPEPKQHKFIGIQVKTSSYQPKSDWWSWNITRDDRRKSTPFFYVLCFEDIDELPDQIRGKREDNVLCAVVPYEELVSFIKRTPRNKWVENGNFNLCAKKKGVWLEFLIPYLNNWDILG